jgi:hypothetical protein
VGTAVQLRDGRWQTALEGKKTGGFFEGPSQKVNNQKIFRFPLYKTNEKYLFCERDFGKTQ